MIMVYGNALLSAIISMACIDQVFKSLINLHTWREYNMKYIERKIYFCTMFSQNISTKYKYLINLPLANHDKLLYIVKFYI